MAKGKSSASSATRKKHARKAAGVNSPTEEPDIPKEKKPKGKEKGSKKSKEPRKKVYIPPVKPAPVQPDPLETLGIAQRLPPELLVVLRRLSKKDSITKGRALEELQSNWVEKARREGHDSALLPVLLDVIPVWVHHVPVLFLHPSRRIRLLAVSLHDSLLKLPGPVPSQFFNYIQNVASPEHAELTVGAWCMSAYDIDRQVSLYARESWNKHVITCGGPTTNQKFVLQPDLQLHLWEVVQRTLLDPIGVYAQINPPQPIAPPSIPQRKGAGSTGRSTPLKRVEDDTSSRSRTDEDEENEADRKARLRIGAFGAAEWILNMRSKLGHEAKEVEELIAPLDNLALWSALYHGMTAPFVQGELESFGYAQPGVRRAAWAFLQLLLRTHKEHLQVLLPTLSSAVLRSAWVEHDAIVRNVMWQPLLVFLKEFPNAWELDAASSLNAEEANRSDEDESDEEEARETPKTKGGSTPSSERKTIGGQAYQEFLQFLELGCAGSPVQAYPAILIVLSTIPSSILASVPTPLTSFFTSFWAAIDGRTLSGLDRAAASTAFLSSLLECTVFLARRIVDGQATVLLGPAGSTEEPDSAQALVREQVKRVWEEISAGRLKVEEGAAAKLLGRTFVALDQTSGDLFSEAWDALSSEIRVQVQALDRAIPLLIPQTLKIFQELFQEGSRPADATSARIEEVVRAGIAQCEAILETEDGTRSDRDRLTSLAALLDTFGKELFNDSELAQSIDETIIRHAGRLLSISAELLLVYFKHRQDRELNARLWHAILHEIALDVDNVCDSLPALLEAAEQGALPMYLRPSGDQLDGLVGRMLAGALSAHGPAANLLVIKRIMRLPEHFISNDCFRGLMSSLVAAFTLQVQNTLHDEGVPLNILTAPLELLSVLAEGSAVADLPADLSLSLLPDLFLLAYLVPNFRDVDPSHRSAAESVWSSWLSHVTEDVRRNVGAIIKQRARDLLLDCSVLPSPANILRMFAVDGPALEVNIMEDVLPPREQLDSMLYALPSVPADTSLAVLDPLVFSDGSRRPLTLPVYDRLHYSSYARITSALLLHLLDRRHTAKENVWALHHLLSLELYAEELLQIPSAESVVFGTEVSHSALQEIVSRVRQLTAYLLSETSDEGWLSRVLTGLIAGKAQSPSDGVEQLLRRLIVSGKDTVRESRILHIVLQHVLASATKSEADQLVMLARKIEMKAPHISLAIILSVTRYCPEPPRLDRYRNELAAGMLSIPAEKANTEGLWTLRRLAATAPDPESDVIFLPTPRAVNLMKACQRWIASDEELDEEVQSEMTSVFLHLAPIVQSVPGAHWDLVFDVMENNLENCSLTDASTLPCLATTLRLLITVQDLASTNKSLRAIWQERRTANLTLVRDLVTARPEKESISAPLSGCRELALSIVQNLPESLIDQETLPKMCHLVIDSSSDVQKMAYQMLRKAAAKRTEFLVVEAGVETESAAKLELPMELVDLLQRSLQGPDDTEDNQGLFGNLLAWMLAFDLFVNTSLRVKSGYIDHMRQLELISEHFLPQIFDILGLYGGMSKAFKLDIWAVEEYYLDSYSPQSPLSVKLLAAHLYYRALHMVPSLIRAWLLDCRDRQLSATIMAYTSTYFSPVIIRAELAQVKDPVASADLADDNLKIKVASAVHEITASYAVDEHELELRLKLPPDWPLHAIEVKDGHRVGVTEERWRSWLLGVQQILTFRSGNIIDGLSFFKKNVVSHFEGQTECAICYSVISAMDGSLPKKPCRTCKNRFHAGCLYKWFSTSHSSSCPLCRSEIIQ